MKRKNKFLLLVCFFTSLSVLAEDNFPLELLYKGKSPNIKNNEDISLFTKNNFPPGNYSVTLFINKKKIKKIKKDFLLLPDKNGDKILTPCFSAEELLSFGVENIKFNYINNCVNLSEIEYLSYQIKIGENSLYITLPQSIFNDNKKIELEKSMWDDGISAIFTNYSISGISSGKNNLSNNSNYINIQSGVNLGAWRYRNYSIWQSNQNVGNKWKNISNQVFSSIKDINSILYFGDIYTAPWYFDSIKLTGVKLETNTMMLPNSKVRYVPNVTGMANSESVITIIQNDNVIYQKTVPAGPFDITDFSPTEGGGNLHVSVKSIDGNQSNYIVPYSSMQNLKPKGLVVYSTSIGKYDKTNTYLSQLDISGGITPFITLIGGAQFSDKYTAISTGLGANLGKFGAFDISLISNKNRIDNTSGSALKTNLFKSSLETHTNFSLMTTHQLNNGYTSFSEALDRGVNYNNKTKDSLTFMLSQNIFENNSISISSTLTKQKNGQRTESFNGSFSSNINELTYSIYVNKYIKNTGGSAPWSIGVNFSLPLKVNNHLYWVNSSSSYSDKRFGISNSTSGSFGEKNQANIALYQTSYESGHNFDYGVSGSYSSPHGNIGGGYSESRNYKSLNYSISGAITLTPYGISMGKSLSDTNSFVVVDGIAGVETINSSMITNRFGVGVQSGLTPYRNNSVILNTKSIPDFIDINENIVSNIIPTKGAFVLSEFKARKGYRMYIKILSSKFIPIGSIAKNDDGEIFMISGGNKLYITAKNEIGKINISWMDNGITNSCNIHYDIRHVQKKNGLFILNERCI